LSNTHREKLAVLLAAMSDRIVSPSDLVSATSLPRYEVLAACHILEALGLIKQVYARGNYKLYTLTETGRKLLDAISRGSEFSLEIRIVEKGVEHNGSKDSNTYTERDQIELSLPAEQMQQ